MNIIEFVGYAGSVLIAVSLMMSNILWLRWINLAGAFIFTAYGLTIGALPVAAVNGFIVVVNIYYLASYFLKPAPIVNASFSIDHPFVTSVLAMKWPELNDANGVSEVEVSFRGNAPEAFRFL